ncbi:MAG: Gfo/Idh/MocA family protein [Planctomycetota bacterium]
MELISQSSSLSPSSRRQFLAASGKVAAASALASAAVPRCHAAESNTIKLALVGCGNRGSGAVGNAFACSGGPVKLHAMADIFENRLKVSHDRLKKEFGEKVDVSSDRRFIGFDAYKHAIDCLGPGDIVLLTTHAAFRPVHFEYAVRKGVNVFMEKSFAVDSPAARRMLNSVAESEKKNLKVAAGFMWRHSRGREEVIERIHNGAIGDVNMLRIYRVHGPGGHCGPLPEGENELLFQLKHPLAFNWTCGGFFVDWHCHNVDVACWAKDAWPISAQAMGGRCYASAANNFDHYTIEYTFADGAKLFAFSRHMANCWQTYSDYAHGSRGSARIMAALGQPKPKIYKSQSMTDDQVTWEYLENEPNPYEVEWQLLLDAVRQDRPHNEGRRAVEADLVAVMGRTAAHTGKMITWEETLNSTFQYVANIDEMTFDSPAPITAGPDGIYPCPLPGVTEER